MAGNDDMIGRFEERLDMGYDYLLVWGSDKIEGSSWFMGKMDMSAQMKAHRETNNRRDLWYVIMQVKSVIHPGEIFTGFERL